MKTINIGLFGCGVVGSGVYKILKERREQLARDTGTVLNVTRICVLHPEKERGIELSPALLTTDAADIIDNPDIDLVIEVVGGERDALGIISRALALGKNVITANKLVIAKYLPQLRKLEDLHGGRLFYGASVCGSVPVLKIIDETLCTDRITRLRGVVNGSTNFILSRLSEGVTWDDALELARTKGFLEADPTADLSGADAAQKLSILAYHAFGVHVPLEKVQTTGITHITPEHVRRATDTGCVIKLVAEARRVHGIVKLDVAPQAIPVSDSLAWVRDEVNILEVECEGVGVQRYIGKGAGSIPTANAVVSDVMDILRDGRYRRQPEAESSARVTAARTAAAVAV